MMMKEAKSRLARERSKLRYKKRKKATDRTLRPPPSTQRMAIRLSTSQTDAGCALALLGAERANWTNAAAAAAAEWTAQRSLQRWFDQGASSMDEQFVRSGKLTSATVRLGESQERAPKLCQFSYRIWFFKPDCSCTRLTERPSSNSGNW